MKKRQGVKEEFDKFAKGIAKLEGLRHQVDSLDFPGFEIEVASIRSKLKDIDAIPQIEKDIISLKKKIELKNEKSAHKDSEHGTLKRKIASLQKIIEKKRRVSVKKQLSEKEMKFVRDVPQLESELRMLRKSLDSHMKSARTKIDTGIGIVVDTRFHDFLSDIKAEVSKRIKEKESMVDQRLKSDLDLQRKDFIYRYRELVKKIQDKYQREIQNELNVQMKNKLERELKRKLHEQKQMTMHKLLSDNERKLAMEKNELVKKLNNEYSRQNSILARKDSILARKISDAEQKSKENENLRNKMKEEDERLKRKLQDKETRFLKNINEKDRQLKNRLESEKREIIERNEKELSDEKERVLKELNNNYVKKLKAIKEKNFSADEKIKKAVELREKTKELMRNTDNFKMSLVRKYEGLKDVLMKKDKTSRNKLEEEKSKIKQRFHENFIKKSNEIARESDEKLRKEIAIKEKEMRARLEVEYKENLKLEIARHNAELQRKKLEMEKSIMEHTKKLFG